MTLDASLAFLGGYAALIWQLLSVLLSWYEDFALSNSLTMKLFKRDKDTW